MAYSGMIADCFNAVSDLLEAAAVAGSIAVDPALVVQAVNALSETPNVQVSLPSIPYENMKWNGSGNQKDSHFICECWVNAQLDGSRATPGGHAFGDGTAPGLLTIAAQVEDAIENGYATLKAANIRVVDVQLLNTIYTRQVPGSTTVSAVVRVDFWLRYIAGSRG